MILGGNFQGRWKICTVGEKVTRLEPDKAAPVWPRSWETKPGSSFYNAAYRAHILSYSCKGTWWFTYCTLAKEYKSCSLSTVPTTCPNLSHGGGVTTLTRTAHSWYELWHIVTLHEHKHIKTVSVSTLPFVDITSPVAQAYAAGKPTPLLKLTSWLLGTVGLLL